MNQLGKRIALTFVEHVPMDAREWYQIFQAFQPPCNQGAVGFAVAISANKLNDLTLKGRGTYPMDKRKIHKGGIYPSRAGTVLPAFEILSF